MKNKIKKIIKEYKNSISEEGGYDDEFIMGSHSSDLMEMLSKSGIKMYEEYMHIVSDILPEIMDDDVKDDLIDNLETLKNFLVNFDNFMDKTHKKNLKRFNKKGS